ncbi:MAG: aminotransferase class IV [Candidatus Schekmanbacteria bacterium]|nr:aminotransferase class IV [Candidatus Schekmanbacteria bacterium]
MTSIYLNGKLYPPDQALISVFDRGFLYGDGVFETLRAYQGKIFQPDAHLERLIVSAEAIGLRLPYSKEQFAAALMLTLNANKLSNACLRLTVSRGSGLFGQELNHCVQPTVVIMPRPAPSCPLEFYQTGVSVIIAKTRRISADSVNPEIKSLNFLNNILAKLETQKTQAYEALMLNPEGFVSEGSVSNIFWVKDGVLKTPSPGVGLLSGITRKVVLDLAGENDIPCEEGFSRPGDLYQAQEAFITNSGIEILPVSQIDDHPVKKIPGEITQKLQRLFLEEIPR